MISIINTGILNESGLSEKTGTINAAPNHPAERFAKISDIVRNKIGFTLLTQTLYLI